MMAPIALSDVAKLAGGTLVGNAMCQTICTDTRSLQAGDLFVALSGEHFDGNQFVDFAAREGAIAVVANRAPGANIPHLIVEDPRLTLGLMAQINRQQFTGPVIGLTGSAGKTTCKEMIASILAESGPVLSTSGNLNNEVGVPMTLLSINPQHRYAVVEMGASRLGDIAYLAGFTQPNVALVTNVMPAHMASFGNLNTIAATKGELFSSLSASGVAVINLDDDYAPLWQELAEGRKQLTFSKNNRAADVYVREIKLLSSGGYQFILCAEDDEIEILLPLLGEHNVVNALAAAATAIAAGASLAQVKTGLSKVEAVNGRLNPIVIDTLTIIDDSYNASPGSVMAAIDVLAEFPDSRCLVLGTMGELGAEAINMHLQVAEYARTQGIDQLIVLGEFAARMAQAFGQNATSFESMSELQKVLGSTIKAETVLIKGSRFMQMELAVESLVQYAADNRGESEC